MKIMKNKILYHSIGSVILSNAKNLDTCTADANRSFAPLRMTRMGAWMTMTMAALALAFTACSEEDIMQPANGQSGSLHISSVIIDGQQVARSRVVAENDSTYPINELPVNHSITDFSVGDEMELYYSFEPVSWEEADDCAAKARFDGSSWTLSGTEIMPATEESTFVIKPGNGEKWEDVKMYASVAPGGEECSIATQEESGNTTPQYVLGDIDENVVRQVTDRLYAFTNDGSITVDTDLKSPTLGAVTIQFKHQDALLRLPKSAVSIEKQKTYIEGGKEYSVTDLATLWAVVAYDNHKYYYPLTEVGDNLQSIINLSMMDQLVGFKAVVYATEVGSDTPEQSTTETVVSTFTIDLPFKVGGSASTGIDLEENTQYPLTLSISPNQAEVNLASAGKPGWGNEDQLSNAENEKDLEYIATSKTFIVKTAAGLLHLNEWMTGTKSTSDFKAKCFAGNRNITAAEGSADALAMNITFMADITLVAPATTGGSNWKAIGTDANPYTGTIEGNGKTLGGMVINAGSEYYQGFVGCLGTNGQIKNLTFADAQVTSNEGCNVGIVAGYNDTGIVENCHTIGTSSVKATYGVGGIVGYNVGTITNCTNAAQVEATGEYSSVGGITSFNGNIVSVCINSGLVRGRDGVGGIVGAQFGGKVIACGNTGSVSGSTLVGGIVGLNESGSNAIASWTKDFEEIEEKDEAGVTPNLENGVGQDEGNITACYSVADAPALNRLLDNMNVTLWTYYNEKNATTGFFWKETTSWPTTVQQTVSSENPFVPNLGYHSNTFKVGNAKGLVLLDKWMNNGITTNDFKAYGFEGANDITAEAGSADALAMNITFMADITLDAPATTDGSNWTPIGTYTNRYTGTIYGNGKILGGMVINATEYSQGFVGCLGTNGQIKNLTFANAQVVISNEFENAGIVAGYNFGKVENCHTISTSSVKGFSYVGGIVGLNLGTITNSTNAAQVLATNERVGGITGDNRNVVSFCINSGSVSGSTHVGGIVGHQFKGEKVIACGNTGSVSGSIRVGGIVGSNNENSNAIASWTITTAEMDKSGTTPGTKDGVGQNYDGNIPACFSVADEAALNSKLDKMNEALWQYYKDNSASTGLFWKETTGNWPTTVQQEVSGNSNPYFLDLKYIPPTTELRGTFEVGNAKGLMLLNKWMAYKIYTNKFKETGFVGSNDLLNTAEPMAVNIKLMNNITLPEVGEGESNWEPLIKNGYNGYQAVFDGNNKTISNLTISKPGTDNVGLIGILQGGSVRHLTLENVKISGSSTVGGIAGEMNGRGSIENCTVSGEITSEGTTGGIVARVTTYNGIVTGCVNHANINVTISSSTAYSVGGIVGNIEGVCLSSGNTGNITVTSTYNDFNVGGIVGKAMNYSSAYQCYVYGCWSINTVERGYDYSSSSYVEATAKDGLGSHNSGVDVKGCYTVDGPTSITNSQIDAMNESVSNHLINFYAYNTYYWVKNNGGWPTLTTTAPESPAQGN